MFFVTVVPVMRSGLDHSLLPAKFVAAKRSNLSCAGNSPMDEDNYSIHVFTLDILNVLDYID